MRRPKDMARGRAAATIVALACALMAPAACGDDMPAPPGPQALTPPVEPQTTAVRQALEDIHHRFVEAGVGAEQHHVHSGSDWAAFWRRFGEPAPVDVDFSRYDVVLVLMGTQGSGGYAIRIEDIVAGATPRARVVNCRPDGGAQIAEVTSPADAVVVEKLQAPLRFELVDGRTGQGNCR